MAPLGFLECRNSDSSCTEASHTSGRGLQATVEPQSLFHVKDAVTTVNWRLGKEGGVLTYGEDDCRGDRREK